MECNEVQVNKCIWENRTFLNDITNTTGYRSFIIPTRKRDSEDHLNFLSVS